MSSHGQWLRGDDRRHASDHAKRIGLGGVGCERVRLERGIVSILFLRLCDATTSFIDIQTGAAERTRDRALPLSRVGSFATPYVHMQKSPSLGRLLEAGQQPQRRGRGRR